MLLIWLESIQVKKMNKRVEMPLIEPVYKTYHNASASAIINDNPSIRNYYLNELMILGCSKRFLNGFTTPELRIEECGIFENPCIEKVCYSTRFLGGCVNKIVKNLLDNGYYVYFTGVDDYYVEGKSWYKEKHFSHDGLICGYDSGDKTYCIYAYDKNWLYQKFWASQKSFEQGRKYMYKRKIYGGIYGLKAKQDIVEFSPVSVYKKLSEYLDSNLEKYPFNSSGRVLGIAVHQYIAEYINKLIDGSIPYERMDRRIFRLIWEHKTVMLERIRMLEDTIGINKSYGDRYEQIVSEANNMRMLYASHHTRRRDSVLPIIREKLLTMYENERYILNLIIKDLGKEIEKNALEISEK